MRSKLPHSAHCKDPRIHASRVCACPKPAGNAWACLEATYGMAPRTRTPAVDHCACACHEPAVGADAPRVAVALLLLLVLPGCVRPVPRAPQIAPSQCGVDPTGGNAYYPSGSASCPPKQRS